MFAKWRKAVTECYWDDICPKPLDEVINNIKDKKNKKCVEKKEAENKKNKGDEEGVPATVTTTSSKKHKPEEMSGAKEDSVSDVGNKVVSDSEGQVILSI